MNEDKLTLNPDDSFVVIKFLGMGSAQFTMHPANVVPAQLFAAARMLEWQAEKLINDEWERKSPPKVAVARVA